MYGNIGLSFLETIPLSLYRSILFQKEDLQPEKNFPPFKGLSHESIAWVFISIIYRIERLLHRKICFALDLDVKIFLSKGEFNGVAPFKIVIFKYAARRTQFFREIQHFQRLMFI